MATYGLIEYPDAGPEVRAVYDDIMSTRKVDSINNFWKALANDPSLLILDDPLASVKSREVEDLLALCRREATTVVAAVHRRNETMTPASQARGAAAR